MVRTVTGLLALTICLAAGWIPVGEPVEADESDVIEPEVVVIPAHARVAVYEEPSGDWYLTSSAYLSRAGFA